MLKVIFECPRVFWNTFQHLSKIGCGQSADSTRTVSGQYADRPRTVRGYQKNFQNMAWDSVESIFECPGVCWNAFQHILKIVRRQTGVTEKIFRKWIGIVLKVVFECPRVFWNTFQHLSKIVCGQSGITEKNFRKWLVIVLKVTFECLRVC